MLRNRYIQLLESMSKSELREEFYWLSLKVMEKIAEELKQQYYPAHWANTNPFLNNLIHRK